MPRIYAFKQFFGVLSCGFYGLFQRDLKGGGYLLYRLPKVERLVPSSAVGNRGQIGSVGLKQDLLHRGALPQGLRQLRVLEGDHPIDTYLEMGKSIDFRQFLRRTGETMEHAF